MVGGEHRLGVEGSDLVLAGGDLSVSGGGLDAELPHLDLSVVDVINHLDRKIGEVLIVELLTLGRGAAEKGTAGQLEIGSLVVVVTVDEEELLLGTGVDSDLEMGWQERHVRSW